MPILVEPKKGRNHTSGWEVPARFTNPSPIVHTRNAGLLLYATAFLWFHKIADFRQCESALVYRKRANTEIRSQHRRILEVLIQEGKELIRRIRAHGGLISAENGFSTRDIQSQVEELRNTLLQWHGGMSKKRKKEILEGVFNGSR